MRELPLYLLPLLAACAGATTDSSDVVDTVVDETDAGDTLVDETDVDDTLVVDTVVDETDVDDTLVIDTEPVDTEPVDTEETDAPTPSACPLPAVDQLFELGAGTSWAVVPVQDTEVHLEASAPLTLSGVVPGSTIGVRLTLPGSLTINRAINGLYVFASNSASATAMTSGSVANVTTDLPGLTLQAGGNLSWMAEDALASMAYFSGTFAFRAPGSTIAPAGSAVTCFAWTMVVPSTLTPTDPSGPSAFTNPFQVDIEVPQIIVTEDVAGSGSLLTWTPGP